jgi:peptidoglycan/xylan/chitin deacetylase (PgdA/CDA1 family)
MSLLRQILLGLYYHASYPVRLWDQWLDAAQGRLPVLVVYCHRVADDRANPWTISNSVFRRQIGWLRDHFSVVSLEEVQLRIARGCNREPCVSITFDDGYADNCQQAVPWLIKERIPCTYFVTVSNVLAGAAFEHDLARGRPCAPNTPEQIRAMAAAGIEIAAHGYTHADLGRITNPRRLTDELLTAKLRLEELVERPVRYFAFPYGKHENLSAAAFTTAKQSGYDGVCSAYGGFNFPGDDPFHLQRIPLDDYLLRLKNWTTVDPRKRRLPRFEYNLAAPCDEAAVMR